MLSSLPLPGGTLGTYFTTAAMRTMVQREYVSPVVRLTAVEIVAGLGGRDGVTQASAIRDWVEDHVEFVRDPDRGEMLHGPVWQINQIRQHDVVYVDCDDVAMLAAALGRAIGLRARFVVVAFGRNAPYRHVWTELAPPNKNVWIDVDITRTAHTLGYNQIKRALKVGV